MIDCLSFAHEAEPLPRQRFKSSRIMLDPINFFAQSRVRLFELTNFLPELLSLSSHGEVFRQPHVIKDDTANEHGAQDHPKKDDTLCRSPSPK